MTYSALLYLKVLSSLFPPLFYSTPQKENYSIITCYIYIWGTTSISREAFSAIYPFHFLMNNISLNSMWEFMSLRIFIPALNNNHTYTSSKHPSFPALLWSSLNTTGLWQQGCNKSNLTLHTVTWFPCLQLLCELSSRAKNLNKHCNDPNITSQPF